MVGPKVAAICVLAASLIGCSTATATLSDLTALDELQARFDQDAGTMRIVLLLAPT